MCSPILLACLTGGGGWWFSLGFVGAETRMRVGVGPGVDLLLLRSWSDVLYMTMKKTPPVLPVLVSVHIPNKTYLRFLRQIPKDRRSLIPL